MCTVCSSALQREQPGQSLHAFQERFTPRSSGAALCGCCSTCSRALCPERGCGEPALALTWVCPLSVFSSLLRAATGCFRACPPDSLHCRSRASKVLAVAQTVLTALNVSGALRSAASALRLSSGRRQAVPGDDQRDAAAGLHAEEQQVHHRGRRVHWCRVAHPEELGQDTPQSRCAAATWRCCTRPATCLKLAACPVLQQVQHWGRRAHWCQVADPQKLGQGPSQSWCAQRE